jgi:hypothetical protein
VIFFPKTYNLIMKKYRTNPYGEVFYRILCQYSSRVSRFIKNKGNFTD